MHLVDDVTGDREDNPVPAGDLDPPRRRGDPALAIRTSMTGPSTLVAVAVTDG